MKRKEQLKKIKMEKKMLREMEQEIKFENLIKIFIALLIFVILFYFISSVFRGDIKIFNKKEDVNKEDIIKVQYDEILLGETFKQEHDEYYVIYLGYSDPMTNTMLATLDSYKTKEDHLPIYVVDMDKGFNKAYLSDDVFVEYNNIEDMKVMIPTLIKINKESIDLVESGYADVTKELS